MESLDLVGQRALLLYPPGLEFVAAFFGCLYAGVVAVPVYPPRRNRSIFRIQSVANDAGTRVALTTDVVLKRVEPLIDSTPSLKDLKWLATCHVPEGMEGNWQPPDIHADTLAFLQYTSGSTGTPKGVVLNHANLVHNSALIAYAFEHTRSGMGVFWLPSYHDMGLIGGILQPLYVGRPNVLMSPMSFLQKPVRWLSAITRFRGTTSGGPNFAYDLCVRNITPEQRKNLDLSSWKVAFNGAEPVRAETIQRFTEVFAPCGFRPEAFYPCFGMAEATLIVSGGFVEKPPVIRWFDAAGLAIHRVVPRDRGAEAPGPWSAAARRFPIRRSSIADPETMTTCPPGQIGEIWASGPSIAQGYWGQPEATQRTFHAYLKDTGEGPFLRTGDLGFMQRGRIIRHRADQGPDHPPRGEPLSPGHRADRLPLPSAAPARARAPRSPSTATAASGWWSSTSSSGGSKATWRKCSAPFAGRSPRNTNPGGSDRADQGGQHSQDLQRQDPASRLPQRLPGRLAGDRRPVAEQRARGPPA